MAKYSYELKRKIVKKDLSGKTSYHVLYRQSFLELGLTNPSIIGNRRR